MKAFEKWLDEPSPVRYGTVDEDSAAKDGWRAALEWVLAHEYTMMFAKKKEKQGDARLITLVETAFIKGELNES